MYYTGLKEVNSKGMHEFKYSYPLGQLGKESPDDSELLMYFQPESMDIERIILRANSLNITTPFTLYAS